MKKAALVLLASAVAMAMIGAGCGGGDDTISKAEFVKRANEICAKGEKELDAAIEEQFAGGAPSQAEQDKFVTETVVPKTQQRVDELRDLPQPDEDADQADAIIDEAQSAIDKVKDDPSLVSSAFERTNQLSTDYGLDQCGTG